MKSLGRSAGLIGSPVGKGSFKDNQPIEIDTYVAKRLRAVSELQNSLNTNIDKFSQLISDCYKDYYKRKLTSSGLAKKEASKLFQELGTALSGQRNVALDERGRRGVKRSEKAKGGCQSIGRALLRAADQVGGIA
jgi:23S rRNA G2069 N7-methylase RlmK/C1962 C5-methylase RlmI